MPEANWGENWYVSLQTTYPATKYGWLDTTHCQQLGLVSPQDSTDSAECYTLYSLIMNSKLRCVSFIKTNQTVGACLADGVGGRITFLNGCCTFLGFMQPHLRCLPHTHTHRANTPGISRMDPETIDTCRVFHSQTRSSCTDTHVPAWTDTSTHA